ncbi:MAG: hypothetical protein ACRD4Y_00395 [Candidatus Acidiferrales bacterium]
MPILLVMLLFAQMHSANPVLNNDFVRVFRDSAPCAGGAPSCGERVFVALGPVELDGRKMERGDIRVFRSGERYSPPAAGEYLEVSVKPGHPKPATPPAGSPPAPDNKVLYRERDFTMFQEKMEPGEKSAAHSHNQRVAIFLNRTQVEQWTNGKDETRELVPDTVTLRPAVVHTAKDVGSIPIRNLLIVFN